MGHRWLTRADVLAALRDALLRESNSLKITVDNAARRVAADIEERRKGPALDADCPCARFLSFSGLGGELFGPLGNLGMAKHGGEKRRGLVPGGEKGKRFFGVLPPKKKELWHLKLIFYSKKKPLAGARGTNGGTAQRNHFWRGPFFVGPGF